MTSWNDDDDDEKLFIEDLLRHLPTATAVLDVMLCRHHRHHHCHHCHHCRRHHRNYIIVIGQYCINKRIAFIERRNTWSDPDWLMLDRVKCWNHFIRNKKNHFVFSLISVVKSVKRKYGTMLNLLHIRNKKCMNPVAKWFGGLKVKSITRCNNNSLITITV